jgi:hypothetical protein
MAAFKALEIAPVENHDDDVVELCSEPRLAVLPVGERLFHRRTLDVDVEVWEIEVRSKGGRDPTLLVPGKFENVRLVLPSDPVIIQQLGERTLRWMSKERLRLRGLEGLDWIANAGWSGRVDRLHSARLCNALRFDLDHRAGYYASEEAVPLPLAAARSLIPLLNRPPVAILVRSLSAISSSLRLWPSPSVASSRSRWSASARTVP